MLCLGRKHPQCSRGQSHRLLDIDQQGIMYKEPIWYLEQKKKAPGCRMRKPFSALNIQDRPEPRSTAGVTSVHSGAPASHKLAPWPPPFSSQSLLTLGMGRGGQQALVMVLIPWSTQLGCATYGFGPWMGVGLQGRDGLEDTAEETLCVLLPWSPPVPCFCSCGSH